MANYRHKGTVHLFEKVDDSWVGVLIMMGVILFLLAACGG